MAAAAHHSLAAINFVDTAMPSPTVQEIYTILNTVTDPEVPVLTILDLGIVRNVAVTAEGDVTVTITPTYSGCPAMDVIGMGIRMALTGRGLRKVTVDMQLQPAWATAWMTEDGKQKLKAYGIAPPQYAPKEPALFEDPTIPCPRCNSTDTTLVSNFGATSCKALYKCNTCHEPFEHFKCH